MSKSRHRQQTGAARWNPPSIPADVHAPFPSEKNVVSSTDCTGLEAQPVLDKEAAHAYADLYAIHAQKTQGNIGKDNPNNDPSEIHFHRT